MPKATTKPTTSGPDAELLSVLAEFDALELRFLEIMARPGDTDPWKAELDEIDAAQDALVDRIYGLHATTLEGFRARARVLARHEPALFQLVKGETDSVEWMVAALVRDLMAGEFGAAPAPAAVPEAAP